MRYGFFDNEKNEYVIDRVDLPTSWTNYLGVEEMAAVVNHTAGGYCFYKTPEYHRITRFRGNSVPMDRPGFYVYLRDNDTKDYWSTSWQPVSRSLEVANYKTRHGLSYTIYECDYNGVASSHRLTIPTIEANSRFFESMDEVPKQAYTMGVGSIMKAKEIILVVTGEQKRDILNKAFSGKVDPSVPASILQTHENVILVGDNAALGDNFHE